MAAHEQRCFAMSAQIPPDHVDMHYMSKGALETHHLRGYDAVFFGGSGAYSVLDPVPWIQEGIVALQRVVDARVPAWASCFGFQGLAVAMGGAVRRDDAATEMGSTQLTLTEAGQQDPLMGTLPNPFWAQEGHHDRVVTVPEGVVELARSERCPEQAFKVVGAPFWASQFHPELDAARTKDRFVYYRTHYFTGDDAEADAQLRLIESGITTPEVNHLLALLIRGGFS